jgi:salicylate hydroxylase
VSATIRAPAVHLFLGMDAHLVAYPVKAGALVNLVAIVHDNWNESGWNAPGNRAEILRHFTRFTWHDSVRELIGVPERWLKWALFDSPTPFAGGAGAVTLIGDAAHPMLPFLAQGAGMAIEDAAVLAHQLREHAEHPEAGLRAYEKIRRARTARVQRAARQQGTIYGRSGPEAVARNFVMRLLGGERLLKRYDWVYNWRRN